jgi:hypothetical protein
LKRLLVTGVGGMGGVNFVRSLRLAQAQCGEEFFIVGTEHNVYHLEFPEVDVKFRTPRHDDESFIPSLLKLIGEYDLELLHPHPSSEAKVVSEYRELFEDAGAKLYLPRPEDIMPDKFYIYEKLKSAGAPVPETYHVKALEDIDEAFSLMGSPLWIRAISGAGGRLSLKVNTPEEAKLWVKLNSLQGRARIDEGIL